MKLTFIGSGSAFTTHNNYHSNMLLESDDGRRLLIDCGSDARFALAEMGLSYLDITDVYVSHLHADHVGGLEWLCFNTRFDPNYEGKPNLYVSGLIVNDLWEHSLSGGLSSLQAEFASLDTFFDVHIVKESKGFDWDGLHFNLVQTTHVMNGEALMPSFGLEFEVNEKKYYLTTDTRFTPDQLHPHYMHADVIFHDCETTDKHSNVHAHYEDLKTLDAKLRSKMWLYHYNPGELPDAKADGFSGFVKKGQEFKL